MLEGFLLPRVEVATGNKQSFLELSYPLIGASFACPDRRGDRDVWSGRGNWPSKPQWERWSEGGELHRSASFRPPKPEAKHRRKKTYTTTTERKSFGELFWPQKKTFRPVVDTKTLWKPAISTTEIFPLWPPFFLQRKVLHWSRAVYAFFYPAEGANRDKFRKPSGVVCSRFPNTIWWKSFEGDGADRAGVIGLIQQGFVRWGWEQISLIVIGSVQIRGSWSADRGAIGQIRDN